MNELAIRLMTTDMNVTDIISDTTSNQGSNSFKLKVISSPDTLLIGGGIERAAPLLGRPSPSLHSQNSQVSPSTLLTLAPTLRIETIAATAIKDTISVHSTAEAPPTSRASRRKSESMRGTPPSPFLFL